MAKKKQVKRMVWKTTLFSTKIELVDIGKNKLERSGYINHFEEKKDAIEYKWRQLDRLLLQYKNLKEELPEQYTNQIKQMENDNGKR